MSKKYKIRKKQPHCVYAGSTVQQNFGETNDKGFLVWEIEDKDKFRVKHFPISNPRPFVTVELEEGRVPDIRIPPNSRLRLVSNDHISVKDLKKAVDVARSIWSPESITVQNKPGKSLSVQEIAGDYENENLRDINVQEKLIKEYLAEYKLDDDTIEQILALNRKYTTEAEQSEEVARNVHWSIKDLKWNNLFNYGEDNSIDFQKLQGIVGIFGKNYSGKSSIVDSMLWSVYNSISKNVRKNVDIINQNKEEANTEVDIQIDNKLYTISRQATKYIKKLHGEETTEAKTAVDFSVLDLVTDEKTSLNGIDRKETDANIRKVFGTLDDFLLTSMTSQMGSMQFINEGSTKRKEILSKFLDLEIFDKKFKLAKDESAGIKASIKKMEGRDFDDEIMLAERDILLLEKKIQENILICEKSKELLEKYTEELSDLKVQAASGSKKNYIDIRKVEQELEDTKEKLAKINEKNGEFTKLIVSKQQILNDLEHALEQYDWNVLQGDKAKLETLNKNSIRIDASIKALETEIKNKKHKISILDTVPCGDTYPACRYLVDANKQKEELPGVQEKLSSEELAKQQAEKEIETLGDSIVKLNECEKLQKNKAFLESTLADLRLKKEKNKNDIPVLDSQIANLEEQKKEYYENEEWMLKLADLEEKKIKIQNHIEATRRQLSECDDRTVSFTMNKGVLTQKVTNLEEQKAGLQNLREEYNAYDLFLKSMHSNGIVYDIIKRRLQVINQHMSEILSNIVNFDVFFEDDGKKLDIYIKHPKYDARPLELGSGAEKSIASIAIRLALIKTSNLPTGDIFILDEPATALDEENMEGFIRILEMIKNQFKTVIIISHLEVLKDIVDKQITIEKMDGFANVNT